VRTQLWVESHQPIPLVPLSMLKIKPVDAIYIGDTTAGASPGDCPDWVLAGQAGLFVCLESGRYFWDDDLDFEHTLGWRLQPDEFVLVRFTNV
jgi:hypothetical protein